MRANNLALSTPALRRFASILLLSLFVQNLFQTKAAESTIADPENPAKNVSAESQARWSINLSVLAKSNSATESSWVEIGDIRSLVLIHRARGRVSKGNIILLPEQTENADHPRIVQPLAQQFSLLGWQVIVPSLPFADFIKSVSDEAVQESDSNISPSDPVESSSANNTDKNEVEPNTQIRANAFFADEQSYQQYINQLLLQITQDFPSQTGTFVLLAHRNSAYWILQASQDNPTLSQLVLLEPTLPENIDANLETLFNTQQLPVFAFFGKNSRDNPFIKAFGKNSWNSRYLRANYGLISSRNIQIEDSRIAKSISGWVKSQSK